MITVHDNRNTNERKLKDIDIDGYFMLDGVLCRRVFLAKEVLTWEGCPFIEVPCGKVSVMDPETYVLPIRNEQIYVGVEDWG